MDDVGISFSVAGLLYPYHIGAAYGLKEEGILKEGTPLAGMSGPLAVAPKQTMTLLVLLSLQRLSALDRPDAKT